MRAVRSTKMLPTNTSTTRYHKPHVWDLRPRADDNAGCRQDLTVRRTSDRQDARDPWKSGLGRPPSPPWILGPRRLRRPTRAHWPAPSAVPAAAAGRSSSSTLAFFNVLDLSGEAPLFLRAHVSCSLENVVQAHSFIHKPAPSLAGMQLVRCLKFQNNCSAVHTCQKNKKQYSV